MGYRKSAGAGTVVAGGVGAVVIFIVVIVLLATWGAFVTSTLWNWFVATTLHAPTLTLPQAYGISLLVTYFTYHNNTEAKTGLVTSVVLLILGFIVHSLYF